MNNGKVSGTLVSVYGNVTIESPCNVVLSNMRIQSIIKTDRFDYPDHEWFRPEKNFIRVYNLEEKMPVCEICKSHIMKPMMFKGERIGNKCPCGYEDIADKEFMNEIYSLECIF